MNNRRKLKHSLDRLGHDSAFLAVAVASSSCGLEVVGAVADSCPASAVVLFGRLQIQLVHQTAGHHSELVVAAADVQYGAGPEADHKRVARLIHAAGHCFVAAAAALAVGHIHLGHLELVLAGAPDGFASGHAVVASVPGRHRLDRERAPPPGYHWTWFAHGKDGHSSDLDPMELTRYRCPGAGCSSSAAASEVVDCAQHEEAHFESTVLSDPFAASSGFEAAC